ncbi:para-nitrobenzyl esterase [Polypterus senegalus]
MSDEEYEFPEDGSEFQHLVHGNEDGEEEDASSDQPRTASPCMVPTRKTVCALCCSLALLLFMAACLAYLSGPSADILVDVTIGCGVVRGYHSNAGFTFKGIPYAVPPLKNLRWRPPVPLNGTEFCWKGIYSATQFRNSCAQVQPLKKEGTFMGDEDCLYLNVWTPVLNEEAKLPVMVWIHGGYLHMLNGSVPGYMPSVELAVQTGVVFVSFNYRLNVLGFLALEILREGSVTNTSGNYGFLDQITALQWVQKNIRAFGGDPANVTIFGQSSGGTSVWTLMMSPLAKGLFHKAIDISGSYIYNKSLEEAEKENLIFLEKANCWDAQCLRSLSAEEIVKAVPWLEYPFWAAEDLNDLPIKGRFDGAVAVVDGYVLPAAPFQMWEQKFSEYNDVPFVIGTTRQESDFSPAFNNISTWTWDDYQWFVRDKLKPFGNNISETALSLYQEFKQCQVPKRCPEKAYTTMVADMRITCPSNDLARRAARALKSPVYRYIVTYTPSSEALVLDFIPFPARFSYHTLDTTGFFKSFDINHKVSTATDRQFQQLMQKYFIHFVKTGKMPPEWQTYPKHIALLSNTFNAMTDDFPKQCSLWEENGFYSYAWIN